MKTFILNKKVVKVYDSIDEMPIVNFQKYNKYLLIDSGIGSDIDSVDEHLVKLAKLIKTDISKANQELLNLRQNLHMIVSSISPKYLAFAALIHSVDGKVVTDLSDDNLNRILNELKAVKHSKLIDIIYRFKKKITEELDIYFHTFFDNPKEKEAYDRLKNRAILVLEGIVADKDNTKEINEIDDYLFSLYKPQSFLGSESVEVKYDKQFESSCTLIAQKTGLDAKSMTVLQFYSNLDTIKKQIDNEQKSLKKRNSHG